MSKGAKQKNENQIFFIFRSMVFGKINNVIPLIYWSEKIIELLRFNFPKA